MTYRGQKATGKLIGIATIVTLGYTGLTPTYGYDPTQSTGTGTAQGNDGSMTTQRGGNSGPTTGRNEHSGSATGAVRDPKQAEPKKDRDQGSHQLGSHSSQEASKSDRGGRGQAEVRPEK